jgi:hypothetical protein
MELRSEEIPLALALEQGKRLPPTFMIRIPLSPGQAAAA